MKRYILVLLLLLVSASALHAQETTPVSSPDNNVYANTITVSGYGTAYGESDLVYLELGVEMVDADLAAAFTSTSESMNAVIQALRDLAIADEDIQTTGVNVFPEDRFNPQDPSAESERVFRVRNTVRVTVRDVTQIEAVISAGLEAGANTIYNLNFGIEDTQTLEGEARIDAVEDARARAQSLADALGVTVGRPVIVSETFNSGIPSPILGRGGAMNFDVSTPVSPGQLSVSVLVQITFAIEG